MGYLVIAGGQFSTGGNESETAVFHFQTAAVQPEQPMPIGMGDPRSFNSEAPQQHATAVEDATAACRIQTQHAALRRAEAAP